MQFFRRKFVIQSWLVTRERSDGKQNVNDDVSGILSSRKYPVTTNLITPIFFFRVYAWRRVAGILVLDEANSRLLKRTLFFSSLCEKIDGSWISAVSRKSVSMCVIAEQRFCSPCLFLERMRTSLLIIFAFDFSKYPTLLNSCHSSRSIFFFFLYKISLNLPSTLG